MARRSRNPRLAKSLRCYTIAEAAELYDVHRNTVRHWQANGLEPIDRSRPTLFHGPVLNAFHKSRKVASKKRCGPGELFCFSCRVPRRPALNMIDYVPVTPKLGTLTGLCPDCGNVMTQKVNSKRLAQFSAPPAVTPKPAPLPIVKSADPRPNCDSAPEVDDNETEPDK